MKVSRPIIYTAVLGVVAYAAFLLTEPEAPPKKPKARTTASASKAPEGFLEEDLNARFARYTGVGKDAFMPGVVPKRSLDNPAAAPTEIIATAAPGATWVLTGITTVNGVESALIENRSKEEIAFLQVGDTWNGLRVIAIEPKAVVLANAEGRETRLAFVETIEDEPAKPGASPSPATNTAPAPTRNPATGG
ncbi:MAG: hypothetical protein OHK0029_22430 [Armatimonadaceae bacterium]